MKLSPGKRSMVVKRKMLVNGTSGIGKDVKKFDEIEELEEFNVMQKRSCREKCCSADCWKRVTNYMRHSSCFIFHKDWKIRKFCVKLLLAPPITKDKTEVPDFSVYDAQADRRKTRGAGDLRRISMRQIMNKIAPDPSCPDSIMPGGASVSKLGVTAG